MGANSSQQGLGAVISVTILFLLFTILSIVYCVCSRCGKRVIREDDIENQNHRMSNNNALLGAMAFSIMASNI